MDVRKKIMDNVCQAKTFLILTHVRPDGDAKTMANYSDEERAKMYSHENWINLANYLSKK